MAVNLRQMIQEAAAECTRRAQSTTGDRYEWGQLSDELIALKEKVQRAEARSTDGSYREP